jgi:hypothetical protein
MKDELVESYKTCLTNLFRETKKHLNSRDFGAEKNIIAMTIPFMILQNWCENGHLGEIPLLDESVKNIILASASTIFGWKKTAYLHLRVALENIFYGVSLFKNKRNYVKFKNTGVLQYKKFNDLMAEFANFSPWAKKANSLFGVDAAVKKLYGRLSEWSHTLGSEFCLDLALLGRNRLTGKEIGEMKESFKLVSKYASIIYLTIKPEIIGDLNPADQRYLLQNLSLAERNQLRRIINT